MTVPAPPDRPALLTRRLRVGEIFDGATALFRAQWMPLLIVAAVVDLPLTLVGWYGTRGLDPESISGRFLNSVIGFGVALLGAVSTLAFILIAAEALEGRAPAPGLLLQRSLALWPRAVQTTLLAGVIVALLLLCLVVPGVIWSVYYTFLLPVVALRGLRTKAALDQSKSLVIGAWWRTLGIILVTSLPALTVGLIMALPIALAPDNVVVRLGIGLVGALAGAFQSIALVILFLNEEAVRRAGRPGVMGGPGPVGGAPLDPGPIYPP